MTDSNKVTLSARRDRRFIRSTYRSNRFVLAEVSAPPMPEQAGERTRPPVNLAFVVDRSGSMAGEKIRLAKLAVEKSIARLQSDDRFAIVVYDDQIEVVFASAVASTENRRHALERLNAVEARNQTNLGEGWLRGCAEVAEHLSADGVNRTLLLTDGLANVGMTNRDELSGHAAQLRQRGVSTTTFGVGTDFDENLLQQMAMAGGGNFYYIAEAAQITDFVTSEVGEALDVVARDVALEIVAPEGVTVDSLSPFPTDLRGGRTRVSVGALVAEQVVEIVLRLNFPYGEIGRETGAVLSLTDRERLVDDAPVRLDWVYADGRTNDLQERDIAVDRAVARVFAARARQEATQHNRAGRFGEARAALAAVAKRIGTYAGRDAEMLALLAELDTESTAFASPMPAAALKEVHFRSYASAKFRMPDGAAFRRTDK